MATATTVSSGNWADDIWDGGSGSDGRPADGDSIVIAAGHSVLMNSDLSGWTGTLNVTIQGHATTPGMLYFKDGTSGYLKIRTGQSLLGTTGDCKGRLLANSDGVWRGIYGQSFTADADTDKITANTHALANTTAIKFYAPVGSTLPAPLEMFTVYYVRDADTNDFKVAKTSGGDVINITTAGTGQFYFNTVLAYSNKAIINIAGTATVDARYLDISQHCYEPEVKYVRTYGTAYSFVAGEGTVDVANNTIDLGTTPPAQGTIVSITATFNPLSVSGGTLCGGLQEEYVYFIRAVSGNKCKLSYQNSDAQIIDLTSTGSGTLVIYTGHTNTSTDTINVLDDVSSVTGWDTTDGHDKVSLCDSYDSSYDVQRLLGLNTINSGTIVLSANIDSTQAPGARIVVTSRNVLTTSSSTSGSTYLYDYRNATTSYGVFGAISNSESASFYDNGIYHGTGHIVSVVANVYYGLYTCTSSYANTVGCSNGFNNCTSCIGINHGNSYSFYTCTSCIGTNYGCSNGFYNCTLCSGYNIGCNYGFYSSTLCTGTVFGFTYGLRDCTSCVVNVYGCNYGVYLSNSCSGNIVGCGNGVDTSISCSCNIERSSYGFLKSGNCYSSSITNCQYGIYRSQVDLYEATISGNTSDVDILKCSPMLVRSFQHGTTSNDTRAWSAGGTMTHETTEKPSGKDYSHKFTYTAENYTNYMEWEISSPANNAISIVVYAKHDATGLTEAQRIHWQIINPIEDPLRDTSNLPLEEWIAGDSTDWQNSTLTHTRTDDTPVILRVSAKRASGNSYVYADQISGGETASSSGFIFTF